VDKALASARRAVEAVGVEHEEFRVRLASGSIALQQAMNLVVERYHWWILLLVNAAVLAVSSFAYRSVLAAVILLVPVNLSNFTLTAAMHLLGIGLDINAVIVAVMGVGVGIDYGIYLLSRICEEYDEKEGDWARAIHDALTTTGKAIMFTASIRGREGSLGSRWAKTQSMPQAYHESRPEPLSSITLTAQSRTPGATPTTPDPLSIAPIVPATCVPWPLQSLPLRPSPTVSTAIDARPPKSECVRRMPVSITYAFTPAPVVV
jgi:hypothetical protein